MKIEILGAESLGVRSLCCFIETRNRSILIDPGIALGYIRHKLLPHPFQVAVGERIQKRIIERWSQATDIIISHFHGDHVPLKDANPYQLDINRLIGLNKNVRIWAKDPSNYSQLEKKRAGYFASILNSELRAAEGKNIGPVTFSKSVHHGEENNPDTVMMTRIEEGTIFVHASDTQLISEKAISQIEEWKANIVLAGGPPLYLSKLSEDVIQKARDNIIRLSKKTDTLILDHHIMRSHEGIKWLEHVSSITGNEVICAADFMKKPGMLLEADREYLYKNMPVPDTWHEDYAKGKVTPDEYVDYAVKLYENKSIRN